jgi:ribonuclease J
MNHIARRGADLVYEGIKHVHVSGHGSEEELKLMLALVKPRFFVPIHGEYRQLARHADMAARVTGGRTTVLLAENGDALHFDADGGRPAGKVAAGRVLIDGTRTGEVADEVLRDRRHLAGDGLVVPILTINRLAGRIEGDPEIVTRGFVIDARTEALLADAVAQMPDIVAEASAEERADDGLMRERLRIELQRLFRKRAGRRPLVLPVVMEI